MPPSDDVAGILLSELRHVVGDLQHLVGAPVQDAWVPDPFTVVLGFPGGHRLLISTWPMPRVHTIERRPRNPKKPLSFQGLLRRRLTGRLDALEVDGEDRVLRLSFGSHALVAHLFGRGGGMWWVEDGHVVAASDGPAPPSLPSRPPTTPDDRPARFGPLEGSWDLGARAFLEQAAATQVRARTQRRVVQHLKKLHHKQQRLVANLTKDLEAVERADALRHHADCLAAALHTLRRGAKVAVVPDLDDPGASVEVPMDPAKSPAEVMNRMYDKAGRLERAMDHVLARLEEAEQLERTLALARQEAEGGDPAVLRQLTRTWRVPTTDARIPQRTTAPFVTWKGPREQEIFVGRNDRSNHALVFRRARGRDWWLHVRDQPGAHVVLPVATRDDTPPLDLLLAAAQIALHHSGVAPGDHVDVQYTRVANVRPIKGAAPGRVQVSDERVLHVTRDPAALDGWERVS